MKGQSQGHSNLEALYLVNEHSYAIIMLLLDTTRKAYMGSPMTLSHLTLSDLKGQIQGHSDFEPLYLVKQQLGHKLLVNFNRKAYMESPIIDR